MNIIDIITQTAILLAMLLTMAGIAHYLGIFEAMENCFKKD